MSLHTGSQLTSKGMVKPEFPPKKTKLDLPSLQDRLLSKNVLSPSQTDTTMITLYALLSETSGRSLLHKN